LRKEQVISLLRVNTFLYDGCGLGIEAKTVVKISQLIEISSFSGYAAAISQFAS
jgi:hypothetical protein